MKKQTFLVLAFLALLFVAGCGPPSTGEDIEIKLAPIHEVTISFAKSLPPQVIVYIKGGLPDGCTTFRGLEIERSGKTVKINVTVQRPKEAICTEIYGFFERNENLGSDFIKGETYTVVVNDTSTTFVMQ
ncbi:MAG: hypothetical protein A2Y92_00410 [Chloroflexi bacterium RBG_13_57_8]|nr:MAG: hypothetical protein A2Y92_00410 [Chloroflexi bacterium RBG_13_57_8]